MCSAQAGGGTPEPALVLSVFACGHRDPVPQPFLPPYHRLSHWAVSPVPTTGLSGLPNPPGAPAMGDSHILAPSHPCPRTPTQYFGPGCPLGRACFPKNGFLPPRLQILAQNHFEARPPWATCLPT